MVQQQAISEGLFVIFNTLFLHSHLRVLYFFLFHTIFLFAHPGAHWHLGFMLLFTIVTIICRISLKTLFSAFIKLYILSSSRSSSYSYSLLFSLYNYVQEDCHAFLTSWLDKRGNYTAELIFVFVSLSYFWQSPFLPWSLFSIFHLHRFKKWPFLLVSENLYHTQMSCRCMHYTCILEQSLQSIENLAIEAPKMLVV